MSGEREVTSLRAIRLKCVDCSGGSFNEVKLCRVFDCPLWRFRLGRRPKTVQRKNPWLLDRDEVHARGEGLVAQPKSP